MTIIAVGCDLTTRSAADTAAVLQFAPRLDVVSACVLEEAWYLAGPAPTEYLDVYRNRCHRLVLPAGETQLSYRAKVRVSPLPDPVDPEACELPPAELPDDVLLYTLPSRYCLSDQLADEAHRRFGHLCSGWDRVQAVVDDVHQHISFRYGSSTATTTALDVFHQREGVCRDYTHLAISYCRALNIPARYVMGYIPDIGVPPPDAPMDFCAWMEVYLGGQWHTFDARLNQRRIGRVVVGRGRDAVDVALLTTFGTVGLDRFEVVADDDTPPPTREVEITPQLLRA